MTHTPSPRPPPRRYLSLCLPLLPTDRIHRQRRGRSWRSAGHREAPLAAIAKVKSALRLVALDEVALAAGLSHGQALADARAMIPALETVDADEAADRALLESIADWAERYTPLVALALPDGLVLDLTGCAHLFGGEAALAADLLARLEAQGFLARAAVAGTVGAAFAAARFGGSLVLALEGLAEILAPLPLAALRLDAPTVAALDRVGLKRIGQLLGEPRAPLAARFGALLLRRLDQALGTEEEAIGPRRPAPALIAERRFAEPIVHEDDIARSLSSLAEALARSLEERGEGARRLELALFRVDGAVSRLAVGAGRPVRAPRLVLDLFREKFSGLAEAVDAGFGFDMVRLSVLASAPSDPVQADLAGDLDGEADLDRLIDRIGARLGDGHVGLIQAVESHVPERAARFAGAAEAVGLAAGGPAAGGSGLSAPGAPIDRPLRLFARPEPVEAVAAVPDGPPVRFRWRRALHEVARAEGPERIAAEWWRAEEPTRDYFRVEDLDGRRFWLYREGLFERETAAPRWFMHGVFA